jgi:hypothetical protein
MFFDSAGSGSGRLVRSDQHADPGVPLLHKSIAGWMAIAARLRDTQEI